MRKRLLLAVASWSACSGPSAPVMDVDPDAGPDAPPDSLAPDAPSGPRPLILMLGQSNAVGQGNLADVDAVWSEPFAAVDQLSRLARYGEPPAFTDYSGPLAPRTDAMFGAELALGRMLPDHDIVECAVGATSLWKNWDPNGTWPPGQPNLYSQCVAFGHAAELARGARVETILWFHGETDAESNALYAGQYGANLVEISGLLLAEFPCARFDYYRLNAAFNATNAPAVRAGQDAAASGEWMTEVNVDALPMRQVTSAHFTSAGYIGLGQIFADVIAGQSPRCAE